jgi:hypothetical protein
MENIKIVRLKTGEDIIGYVSETEAKLTISYPMAIDLIEHSGVHSFTISSWLPHQLYKINEADLWMNDILFVSEVANEFISYYKDMVDKLTKYIAAEEIMEHMKEEQMMIEALNEREISVVH